MRALLGCLVFIPSAAIAQPADRWVELRPSHVVGLCLDIQNDGATNDKPILATCERVSGQRWRVRDAGDGYVRLSTEFRPGMCLDLQASNEARLMPCAKVSGQRWLIRARGADVQLTSEWRGTGSCLDIRSKRAVLKTCDGHLESQRWQLRTTE